MKKLTSLLILLLLVSSLVFPQTRMGGKVSVGGKTTVSPSFAGGGGEVDFVTDSFTEGSDTGLESHTPELGSSYIDHTDAAYTDTIAVLASTDRIFKNSGTSAGAYYNDASPPSADYCVEGVIHVLNVISANTSIVGRLDTAANTMYIFQINNGTGWRVRKIVAGVQTTLGVEDTTTNIPSVGQSRTMKMCMIGTTISAYINGSVLSTVGGTDSAISAAGKAGVRFSGTFTDSTGYHLESFRAFTP